MEKQDSPIHRWLASVEGQPQNHHGGEKQDQDKNAELAAKIPRMQLEISDDLKGPEHSFFKKRNADQLDTMNASRPEEPVPRIKTHKRSRQSYELRSRHKTREDHYEYKGPLSVVGSQSQAPKPKTKKSQGRRHTMNDDFHAINVTENRLTLRNNPNLGIFSKGKTSSTNHHQKSLPTSHTKARPRKKSYKQKSGSDLAFSEMMFLSNIPPQKRNIGPDFTRNTLFEEQEKDHNNTAPPVKHPLPNPSEVEVSQTNTPLAVGQREGSYSPPLSFQDLKLPSHHPSKIGISDSNKYLGETQHQESYPPPALRDPAHPLHDSSRVNMLVSAIQREESYSPPPPKRSRSPSLDYPQKRRKLPESSSSVPFTWTESEDDNTERDQVLEQRLLALMHVGLCPQGISSDIPQFKFEGKYWSLSELWILLKERKVLWSNEASNRQQAAPTKTTNSVFFNVSNIHDVIFNRSQEPKIALEADCDTRSSLSQHDLMSQQRQIFTSQSPDKEKIARLSTKSPKTCSGKGDSIDGVDENQRLPLTQESADEQFLPSASAPELPRPSLYDIDLHGLSRVEDDDLFYQTLDDAYHAIVRPKVAAEVASDLQRLLTSPEHSNPFGQHKLPRRIPISSPHNAHPETTAGDPTLPVQATGNTNQEKSAAEPPEGSHPCERPTSHENDNFYGPSNDLPWLAAYQPQLHRSTMEQTGQSRPPGPFGFWRQNKLY